MWHTPPPGVFICRSRCSLLRGRLTNTKVGTWAIFYVPGALECPGSLVANMEFFILLWCWYAKWFSSLPWAQNKVMFYASIYWQLYLSITSKISSKRNCWTSFQIMFMTRGTNTWKFWKAWTVQVCSVSNKQNKTVHPLHNHSNVSIENTGLF